MDAYSTYHDILVNLFNEIMTIEEKALIQGEFKDISINDMHIIEAIGTGVAKTMTTVANLLSVTVGTLTIAINNLVKKGYVQRVRSEKDRRVVLISLLPKGHRAYEHHKKFHEEMIQAIIKGLSAEEQKVLKSALTNLRGYFNSWKG